jgi:cell fate (sporulation/competence/biofilm development) regulator YmcA (YheA/YmcA/DUF963 family)
LQLLSVKTEGYIEYEGIEPTFEEEIALKLDEDIDNVSVTLSYLSSMGLLEESQETNKFFLIEASNQIGSEGQSAERKRRFDEKKKLQIEKAPKSNALRQKQFRAKKVCEEIKYIPYIDDYTNNKRYNGNYYLVFKRDKMKCAICGSTDSLCVHHIDGYDENNPQNNEDNKMITMCRTCHARTHAGLEIQKEILESIHYFEENNESNEIGNGAVTDEKQTSISNSNSCSISQSHSCSNSTKSKKERNSYKQIINEYTDDEETEKAIFEFIQFFQAKQGCYILDKQLRQFLDNLESYGMLFDGGVRSCISNDGISYALMEIH